MKVKFVNINSKNIKIFAIMHNAFAYSRQLGNSEIIKTKNDILVKLNETIKCIFLFLIIIWVKNNNINDKPYG